MSAWEFRDGDSKRSPRRLIFQGFWCPFASDSSDSKVNYFIRAPSIGHKSVFFIPVAG